MASEVTSISATAKADAPITSAELIGVMTLYITVCTVFTFARLWTRLVIHQQLWWDDWAMLCAWIGTISLCVLQLVMLQYGAGVNIWEVPDDDLKEYLKLFLNIQMVARIAIFFARLSILLLYIRIFFPIGTPRSVFWWVIQGVIWLNLLYTISLILALTLQCVPYHKPWGSSCINQWLVLVNASVINIISDIAVLVIPIASILKLRTTKKKKWAIWALFAFGALAPLASVARLGYQIPVANGSNKTVIYPIVLLLATAEQAVAMIVGSAPVASVAVIRLVRRKLPVAAGRKKTLTQRMWPSREATTRPVGKIPDPYPITGGTDMAMASSEVLYSHSTKREPDAEHFEHVDQGDTSEMYNRETPNVNGVMRQEV
ncbi:hypothetical protein F5Y19DRAFT_160342 [Xylariaceae sp. FL1651]|nr:hypothetical protein F5Y19DRAFT_160342 [Xylariaceae sp. FL1651]